MFTEYYVYVPVFLFFSVHATVIEPNKCLPLPLRHGVLTFSNIIADIIKLGMEK